MVNITFILRPTGEREIVHQGELYSQHLDLYRDLLQAPPADVAGIEVWRAARGRVKNISVSPGESARSLEKALGDFRKGIEAQAEKVSKAIAAEEKALKSADDEGDKPEGDKPKAQPDLPSEKSSKGGSKSPKK